MLAAPAAYAEPPRTKGVAGIELGDAPDDVLSQLRKDYAQCNLQRSVYQALPGENERPLAEVAINEGTLQSCAGTPEGGDLQDALVVRFAHASVEPGRSVFHIRRERTYPDAALAAARIQYPWDKLLASLRKTYGRPTDERREHVASASTNAAVSLGIGGDIKREDVRVRLLWAPRGRLAADRDLEECDCGGSYVAAEIEITRSPRTRPANRFFVTKMTLFVEDPELRRRQEAWNAARPWLQAPK
jgi:hypothetical protein